MYSNDLGTELEYTQEDLEIATAINSAYGSVSKIKNFSKKIKQVRRKLEDLRDSGVMIKLHDMPQAVNSTNRPASPRRVQRRIRGESKRSSAKSGDSNSDDSDPDRPCLTASLLPLQTPTQAREFIGVSDDATPDDIRDRCRTLASQHHPDRGGDPATMAAINTARSMLLSGVRTKPDKKLVCSPQFLEMEVFAKRCKVDLAAAYLALERIQKWGLDLDHPRSEKLARAERNRFMRGQWSIGVSLDRAEAVAGSSGHAGDDLENHREQCRDAIADFRYAPAGWDDDAGAITRERIEQLLALKHSLKRRDRETIELRFEKGLSIPEIAAEKGQCDKTIYAAFVRMRDILPAAMERKLWVDEHCKGVGTGDAPVILEKNQQLGWDMESLGGDA